MTRTNTLGLSAMLIVLSGLAYACSSVGTAGALSDTPDERTGGGTETPGTAAPPNAGAGAKDPALTPVDNAVILVHAAKTQSFRLCFKSELDRRPQPDSDVMPDSNVVGVEVGAAVRLAPLRGAPGDVLLFEEPLIRAFYPAFGGAGAGPSCEQLLANMSVGSLAVNLGAVSTDLSKGVHLLVVKGCPGDTQLRTFSKADCGDDWTSAKGNLGIKEITLTGAKRPSAGALPAQVVNLSQPLDGARAGRDVVVSFGELEGSSKHEPVATNPQLFGSASENKTLNYPAEDTAIYDNVGFRVQLVVPGTLGTQTTILLDESLAKIQKLSSPRDVPPSYYAAASNYALLLLGDPDATLTDGGADMDLRRNLHFLAVPVISPKAAESADGGTSEPGDGGSAPLP